MSDSGIGRELHVVVGQGQLDAVLSARPEDRRGFIEEAAGVLKHKKRKEKALRKLDAMQANLTRLQDLTAELRRQLKPLGRQAEVARRAAAGAGRPARRPAAAARRRPARRCARRSRPRSATRRRCARAGPRSRGSSPRAQAREAELEAAAGRAAPRLARAQETVVPAVRARGAAARHAPRWPPSARRHLTSALPEEARPGRDPEALRARGRRRPRAGGASWPTSRAADAVRLQDAVTRRTDARGGAGRARSGRWSRPSGPWPTGARGWPGCTGQVGALRSRAAAAEAEIGRLARPAGGRPRARRSGRRRARPRCRSRPAALDEGELDLDERHEQAAAALGARARTARRRCRRDEREAERDRSTWSARRDALAMSLARKDGAGALLAAERLPGRARHASPRCVAVEPGAEAAVAAALGAAADAVAVGAAAEAAVDALAPARADDAGRAGMLVGGEPRRSPRSARRRAARAAPAGRSTSSTAPAGAARRRSAGCCAGVVVVDGPRRRAARSSPRTPTSAPSPPTGDLLGADWAGGGSASARACWRCRPRVDEAAARLDEATHRVRAAALRAGRGHGRPVQQAAAEVDAALVGAARVRRPDGRGRRAARPARSARSAAAEAEAGRLEQARVRGRGGPRPRPRGARRARGAAGAGRGRPGRRRAVRRGRDRLAAEASAARAAEVEARLAVRTGRGAGPRAGRPGRGARAGRPARSGAGPRAARSLRGAAGRDRGAAVAGAWSPRARRAGTAAGSLAVGRRTSATPAQAARAEHARPSCSRLRARAARAGRRAGARSPTSCTATRSPGPSSGCASRRSRPARRGDGAGAVPTRSTLLAEYGPDGAEPVAATAPERRRPAEPAVPYDRAEQEKRARQRPSGPWPCSARSTRWRSRSTPRCEERSAFLTTQLEDLKATRRDLLTVVARGRRAHPGGLRGGLRRHRARVRARLRRRCSPAVRAGWCSPSRTTCSPPASRSRPGRPARRSSGCRCCPAASAR